MNPNMLSKNNTGIKVCLLGANFDTGNMGVGALAEASVKCILHTWPDAEVTLLGPGRVATKHHVRLSGREVCLNRLPVRFSKNILLSNHFSKFFLCVLMRKIVPSRRISEKILVRNPSLRAIVEADVVADITGGDSFSDIYGMFRLLQLTSLKLLMLMFNKKLVLLPQTYGPFSRRTSRMVARYILNRASAIYSRDKSGISYVQNLLGHRNSDDRIRFCPDVAFVLDAHKPTHGIPGELASVRANNNIVVGLNVSGLLFGPDGTRNNQFGLAVSYPDCVMRIIEMMLANEKVVVILVPHVFSRDTDNRSKPHAFAKAEADWSDTSACRHIFERMHADYPGRIFVVDGWYDQAEIKYIIGMCDFFIGARMHACIAALSQGIPAVGLAYSKKFAGVFESIGVGDMVVDMRGHTQDEILAAIRDAFDHRQEISQNLKMLMPDVQATVLRLFADYVTTG